MKPTEHVEFSISKAFNTDLPAPITGTFDMDAYENKSEIKATDLLDDDEYTQAVNARIKAKLRAKATTAALAAASKAWSGTGVNPYEKPDQNTPEVQRATVIKMYMKLHGINEEQAVALVDGAAAQVAALKAAK